mmetsp:Transcript_37446/g.106989  ORF Transcript_37446/g.106989 Transcript_37446/m.106989 type:complete len:239 (-) Transcript_37446:82-798(-)
MYPRRPARPSPWSSATRRQTPGTQRPAVHPRHPRRRQLQGPGVWPSKGPHAGQRPGPCEARPEQPCDSQLRVMHQGSRSDRSRKWPQQRPPRPRLRRSISLRPRPRGGGRCPTSALRAGTATAPLAFRRVRGRVGSAIWLVCSTISQGTDVLFFGPVVVEFALRVLRCTLMLKAILIGTLFGNAIVKITLFKLLLLEALVVGALIGRAPVAAPGIRVAVRPVLLRLVRLSHFVAHGSP